MAHPKVSVCMITYNHERYIAQAIESVLEQEIKFDLEIVIGDDCSTDETPEIVLKYARKYPHKIRAILNKINCGMSRNFINTIKACNGQYIALLEGDDYWTDPLKLQKQVDFLDANPAYSFCCHRYREFDEEEKMWKGDDLNEYFDQNVEYMDIGLDMFTRRPVVKTLTVVFRGCTINCDVIAKYKFFRDTNLVYHLLVNGHGRLLNSMDGVYRRHGGGIFGKKGKLENFKQSDHVFRELYGVNKSIFKQWYSDNLNYMLDAKIMVAKRPLLCGEIYADTFRLLSVTLSVKRYVLKMALIFATSVFPKTLEKITNRKKSD